MLSVLDAISPIEDRYAEKVTTLRPYFSGGALIKYRLRIECEWLIFLIGIVERERTVSTKIVVIKAIQEILEAFSDKDIVQIKETDDEIDHEVKAIEYYLQEKLKEKLDPSLHSLVISLIHLGCTSEDISNLAYALILRAYRQQVLLPMWQKIILQLNKMAEEYANISMLSRTHGQAASPTTVGKELANFVFRLKRQFFLLMRVPILGKFSGASGNLNALRVAFPNTDWVDAARMFTQKLGLIWNPLTTQIEPHDNLAEFFAPVERFNTILIDMCRDIWGYISLGYFTQKVNEKEVGSSTMPHKINPIKFENGEGNLGIANALFTFFSQKLPISRWQRDLSDSTVMKNIGVAFAHSHIAYDNICIGLGRIDIDEPRLYRDLWDNWEVLSEAIQTVMRKHGIMDAFEQLKDLTRGKKIEPKDFEEFITGLVIPEDEKIKLLELTPLNYIGYAAELAVHKSVRLDIKREPKLPP
ncbi:MAG: adenylosuccinate lyase [Nitrosopumilaceae archaeon]